MVNSRRRYDVLIVGGLGHIGLPFGLVLADAGFQVALYDTDLEKQARVTSGEMPFLEYDAEPILKRTIGRSLHISTSLDDARDSDCIVITIGTPVDEYLNPKMMPMLQ